MSRWNTTGATSASVSQRDQGDRGNRSPHALSRLGFKSSRTTVLTATIFLVLASGTALLGSQTGAQTNQGPDGNSGQSTPHDNNLSTDELKTTISEKISSDEDTGGEPAAGNSGNSRTIDVTVNGQPVPVPNNGSIKTTVPNTNGQTTKVEIHSNSSSTGTTWNNSSASVKIQSNSTSTGSISMDNGSNDRLEDRTAPHR